MLPLPLFEVASTVRACMGIVFDAVRDENSGVFRVVFFLFSAFGVIFSSSRVVQCS